MSEVRKSKKIVNSIGVGIMAVLSSGTSMLQIASAADVGQVQDAGEMLENNVQATSLNQGTIAAMDQAGDAINSAQGAITSAGEIPNGAQMQGELSGSANAMGKLDKAVEDLYATLLDGRLERYVKTYSELLKPLVYTGRDAIYMPITQSQYDILAASLTDEVRSNYEDYKKVLAGEVSVD